MFRHKAKPKMKPFPPVSQKTPEERTQAALDKLLALVYAPFMGAQVNGNTVLISAENLAVEVEYHPNIGNHWLVFELEEDAKTRRNSCFNSCSPGSAEDIYREIGLRCRMREQLRRKHGIIIKS